MRFFRFLVVIALAGVAGDISTSAAARADCAVAVSNAFAIGFDRTSSTVVYGFNISRGDKSAIDARLVALGSDGARLQEFEARGAGPTVGTKPNEWAGLAFGANGAAASIQITAESEPGGSGTRPCTAPAVSIQVLPAPRNEPIPNKRAGLGPLDLPDAVVPASGAAMPCDIQFSDFINQVALVYPQRAVSAGRQGQTTVVLVVGNDGTLNRATVWTPSGSDDLDNAALFAARHSTFTAATVNGTPVVSHFQIIYEFQLEH